MPFSTVIELFCKRECGMSLHSGVYVQGLFYSLLREWNRDISVRIHADDRVKPFTVSAINGFFLHVDEVPRVLEGLNYWIRFTALTDELADFMLRYLVKMKGRVIRVGEAEFEVKGVYTNREHSWSRRATYYELWSYWFSDKRLVSDIVRVRFITPTYFKSNRQSIPLPICESCMLSIYNKWNAFSNWRVEESLLRELVKKMVISYLSIKTEILRFNGFSRIGFVGDVEFRLLGASDELVRLFNLLWDYAFFSCVGASTTYGMGQIQLTKSFND